MAIEPLPFRIDDQDPRPPRQVGGDVDRVLARFGAPPAPVMDTLAQRWAEVVGPLMVEHTTPAGLVEGRLRIDATSSTWAAQMRWSRAEVLTRCAALLGPGTVVEVEVRVAPSEGR